MPTALIVEDEPEANKLLGMLVRLKGYQAASALTGREALRFIELAHPDIIFLDLMLPDLSGYEVCKILKSSKATSLIPLAIVTARLAAENRLESFCLGADDFVPKPYTPEQIFFAMDRAARWQDQSRSEQIHARIGFERQDDGEILRRLGQLRSLVFARSTLSFEASVQVSRAVKEIWCLAEEWARTYPDEALATLDYTFTPECLTLTFHEVAGWLGRVPALVDDASSSLHVAGFDQIHLDAEEHRLTLSHPLVPNGGRTEERNSGP
jgi:DNA-binding response OmpR family regulator